MYILPTSTLFFILYMYMYMFLCEHVCLWEGLHVCVHLCMCVHVHLHAFARISEINSKHLPQSLNHFLPHCLRQGIRLSLELTLLARLVDQWTPGSLLCLSLQHLDWRHLLPCPAFYRTPEELTSSSCLYSKHIANCSISPASSIMHFYSFIFKLGIRVFLWYFIL